MLRSDAYALHLSLQGERRSMLGHNTLRDLEHQRLCVAAWALYALLQGGFGGHEVHDKKGGEGRESMPVSSNVPSRSKMTAFTGVAGVAAGSPMSAILC